jgi:hypothetical protein
MLDRLLAYRILRHDARDDTYTTHPLIRNHYYACLTAGERAQTADAHARIKDYYLELAGDTPTYPTLDDLAPLIEVMHHACLAGAYDEAWQVYRERIDQRGRWILTNMGAWDTDLALVFEFFPDGDASQESLVSKPSDKRWSLNEVGLCMMSLGRLGEAVSFYECGNAMDAELEDWRNASRGYHTWQTCTPTWARWPKAPRPPPRRWPWPVARRTSRMSATRWPGRRGALTYAATCRRQIWPLAKPRRWGRRLIQQSGTATA